RVINPCRYVAIWDTCTERSYRRIDEELLWRIAGASDSLATPSFQSTALCVEPRLDQGAFWGTSGEDRSIRLDHPPDHSFSAAVSPEGNDRVEVVAIETFDCVVQTNFG